MTKSTRKELIEALKLARAYVAKVANPKLNSDLKTIDRVLKGA